MTLRLPQRLNRLLSSLRSSLLAQAPPDPAQWGLERRDGRLSLAGCDLTGLTEEFGSPLHVVDLQRLRSNAQGLQRAFSTYPGPVRMHFSYKTNQVAGVLTALHAAGVGAEVVDGYELWLALRLGVDPADIVFNGPNKSDAELRAALEANIGLIVVDGLDELTRLERTAAELQCEAQVALRICPDIIPRGMNTSSMTGSRQNQFGLDLTGGEVDVAIGRCVASPRLTLRGTHAHIGSGIHDLAAFRTAADRVLAVQARAHAAGARPDLIDLGGGLGTRLSRELTTLEMLTYLGLGRLPRTHPPGPTDLVERYAAALAEAIGGGAARHSIPVPTLVLEPGRMLTSDAQVLLLTVGAIRHRQGVGNFALVDGGAMTVSMMFLSELHTVLLANRADPVNGRTSIFGRLPSPMDVVYRNLPSPRLAVGDVIAVLDAGAYFTSTSTNFGGPRPAVVLAEAGQAKIGRRRETFEDLARLEQDLPRPGADAGNRPSKVSLVTEAS